jgi:hypothetical protein
MKGNIESLCISQKLLLDRFLRCLLRDTSVADKLEIITAIVV